MLKVKPVGINTANNTINFENHNFQSGEIVEYTPSSGQSGDIISGLTTTNQYKVVKIDDNSFRLCDVGVGATISSNYISKNYIQFEMGTASEQKAFIEYLPNNFFVQLGPNENPVRIRNALFQTFGFTRF